MGSSFQSFGQNNLIISFAFCPYIWAGKAECFLKETDATCSSKIVKDALVNCLLSTNLCESRQESGKQKVAKKSSGETARPEVISLGFLL